MSERPRTGADAPRVLMLTPDEGHLDRRIAQEAGTLAAHGWLVDIFPAVDPRLTYESDLAPGVSLLANPRRPARPDSVRRRALRRAKRFLARAVPPAGRLVETIQYRTRDIAGEITLANLSHLLGQDRAELIFAHDVPVMPLAIRLREAWGSALIVDLHEVFPEQDEHFTSAAARSYWRTIEGAGLAAASGIICVNDAVAEYVRENHAPSAPVAVIRNAVPYARSKPGGSTLRTLYAIPEHARIALFVGTLRRASNLEVLIDGFAEADLPGWVLAILGEGPLRDRLETIVRKGRLGDRVFLGRRVDQRDLIPVASSADLALLPYVAVGLNHLIATPNKLFEYVQARLPVAASRLPMVEQIIGPRGNGAFLDFSSVSGVASGLASFIRESLPTISPEALEAAARDLSWEREEPVLLEIVELAIRGVRSRGEAPPVESPGAGQTSAM